jgi:DNA-directed RNA polymerase alpha subunit
MAGSKHFVTEEARRLGEKLGVDSSRFDVEQFRMGMDVELEHGKISPATNVTDDDPTMTAKIALAHLNEFPDYYTRLAKLEKEAEQALKKKKK